MSWSHACWPKAQHVYLRELVKADHGGKLPEWAREADLVFHADEANHPTRPVSFPGRRELRKLWGTTERETRDSLADPGWQEKCDSVKIPRPTRHMDGPLGDGKANCPRLRTTRVPASVPPTSPHETNEPEQSTENVPGSVPASVPLLSPPLSTRAELDPPVPPLLLSSSPQKKSAPLATLALVPDPGPKKRRRKPAVATQPPETDWARQWTDAWADAWRAARPTPYPWDWHKDRVLILRAAGAVGAAPDEPMPPGARDRLLRAIGAYLDAAARGAAWPPGPPTVQGFVAGLSGWVQAADGVVTTMTGPPARAAPRAGFGHAGDGVLERLWDEINDENGVFNGK